jgi:hypothetical protein
MKNFIATVILIAISYCSYGQAVEVGKLDHPIETHRDKSDIALFFTGSNQNLGFGLILGTKHTTDYNLVYGFDADFFYKHFTNTTPGAKVTNFGFLLPLTVGYKFSFNHFFIIPNAGLFGAFAMQSQVWNDAMLPSSTALIGDWGYIAGARLGYEWPKIALYLGIEHIYNFDADNSDGHFFQATPVSLGILYNEKHRKKKHY